MSRLRPGTGPKGPRGGPTRRPGRAAQNAKLGFRRALTLLGLTLLAPGSAQLVAGVGRRRRLLGTVVLRTWVGFLGTVVLLAVGWLIHREWVLGIFTHHSVLRVLAVLLIVVGAGWPLLIIDAWGLADIRLLPLRSRRQIALLAIAMVIVTCLVPIAAGRRVWAGAELLGGVFGSDRKSAAVAGRYNVLLLGGDAGPDRIGTRPDSVNLASIDEKTGRTALISLPRNLQNVPFPAGSPAARALPAGWSCGDKCLLNAIYQWGSQNRQYFPGAKDPGAEAMKQAVQAVTGLTVNYYVMIDLQGFRSMIDAVGGIDLAVASRVPIGGGTSPIKGYIEPGKQHLNGFQALWYGRSREGSSDYERMARQRCVMTAMVNQLDPSTLLRNFQRIASAGKQVVSTDIPAAELPAFLTLGQEAKSRRIESVQFVPPLIVPHHPDYSVIRQRVTAVIATSEQDGDARAGTPAPTVTSAASDRGTQTASTPTAPKPTATTRSTAAAAVTTGIGSTPSVDVRQVCKVA
ncbi:MAG TPA: LCP family protein [Kineosporiaceae bacterium]|nr:LCP family protein [Kineosporiaceae bacterium]